FLALEVVVDGRLREPDTVRDVVQRRDVVALLAEQRGGDLDDLGAPVVSRLPPGAAPPLLWCCPSHHMVRIRVVLPRLRWCRFRTVDRVNRHGGTLSVLEARGAPLLERRHALLLVVASVEKGGRLDRVIVSLRTATVENPLGHLQREGGFGRDEAGQAQRLVEVLPLGGHRGDQSGEAGFLRVEPLTGEDHVLQPVQVGVGGSADHAESGHQADRRLGGAELGGAVGDDDVGHHRQLAAAAEGEAVHGGDRRLGEGLEGAERGEGEVLVAAAGRDVVEAPEALDVAARAEAAPRTVHHQHPDPGVRGGVREQALQVGPELERQRVELLGTVEGDHRRRILHGHGQHAIALIHHNPLDYLTVSQEPTTPAASPAATGPRPRKPAGSSVFYLPFIKIPVSVAPRRPLVEPYVALMRRYCVDYTTAHDPSVCDEIMSEDYEITIAGRSLGMADYRRVVATTFRRFPTLMLTVHDMVLSGDRLAMRFSE